MSACVARASLAEDLKARTLLRSWAPRIHFLPISVTGVTGQHGHRLLPAGLGIRGLTVPTCHCTVHLISLCLPVASLLAPAPPRTSASAWGRGALTKEHGAAPSLTRLHSSQEPSPLYGCAPAAPLVSNTLPARHPISARPHPPLRKGPLMYCLITKASWTRMGPQSTLLMPLRPHGFHSAMYHCHFSLPPCPRPGW